jgi:PAS domain S-box-containing protein
VITRPPLRILSIEDDPKDTELIQDLLETEGIVCEVTRVDTEASLQGLLKQGGVDLILADYSLPSFDGVSALKLATKACPDVPFIFVSGTLGEEVAIEALKIGATDYVLKTRLSRLVPSVLRALREATQRAERERAEESLRQSEAYLAEAQRLSHTGSFGWRPSTGEILWSEETHRIFQYDRATKPTVELVLQRVHPDDTVSVKETIERASQGRKDFEHEYRLVMPDGSVKYVHVVAHALNNESDGVEFVGAIMDVSDRRRAEEQLRRSEALAEQRLRLVVDTTPAMLNSCRPDGHLDYVNKGWLDYFGFSLETALDRADVMRMSMPSKTDMYGSDWRPVIHPEDLPGFTDHWKSMLVSGKPDQREARVRRFDGVYRWHLFRAVPLYDETGKLVKWYASAFDIEDHKRAEEALRRSEGYLGDAQRLTRTGSWAWNVPTRQSVYWSQENYRLFGFDPEGGIPSDEAFYQRVHPEDRDRVRREVFLERPDEGSPFDVDFRIVLPGGTIKYVRSTGHPVRSMSGDVLEYIGTSMDVTERKRGEQVTRLLAAVVESSHDAIVSKNLDGTITSWNTGAERLFGYAPEEAVGQNITLIIPPDRRDEERAIVEQLTRGERVDHFETVRMHKDGSLLDVALTISPMKDAAGRIVGASKLARDITERKRAEEALRQAQADLAYMSRVTTMGELTASLAHEIRQPISAAVTNAKTCLRWLGRDEPDVGEACEAASRLVKDVTRAADIIGRISSLFKKDALQRELVDVNELIREMIVLLRSEASRYSILIRTELAEGLPKVMADRVQLQQVLMNLMLNGIEAMEDVGTEGELTITSQQGDNHQLLISVGDTGVGLEPEQAKQIFNAFFTTKPQGSGMGLPISRSIIESHGGHLWATSNSGPGATFQFTLRSEVTADQAA